MWDCAFWNSKYGTVRRSLHAVAIFAQPNLDLYLDLVTLPDVTHYVLPAGEPTYIASSPAQIIFRCQMDYGWLGFFFVFFFSRVRPSVIKPVYHQGQHIFRCEFSQRRFELGLRACNIFLPFWRRCLYYTNYIELTLCMFLLALLTWCECCFEIIYCFVFLLTYCLLILILPYAVDKMLNPLTNYPYGALYFSQAGHTIYNIRMKDVTFRHQQCQQHLVGVEII